MCMQMNLVGGGDKLAAGCGRSRVCVLDSAAVPGQKCQTAPGWSAPPCGGSAGDRPAAADHSASDSPGGGDRPPIPPHHLPDAKRRGLVRSWWPTQVDPKWTWPLVGYWPEPPTSTAHTSNSDWSRGGGCCQLTKLDYIRLWSWYIFFQCIKLDDHRCLIMFNAMTSNMIWI